MDRPIDVEDLVGRAREGDADAFGRLATHFWRPLVGLARSVLAPADGAEDAVQDALVVAWGELARLERDAAFGAWVRRILVRRCLRRARRHLPLDHPAAPEPSRPAAEPSDVPRFLARLPPRQRAVVYLSLVEGMSDREVGEALDIRPSTARVHLLRGRRTLRKLLGNSRNGDHG